MDVTDAYILAVIWRRKCVVGVGSKVVSLGLGSLKLSRARREVVSCLDDHVQMTESSNVISIHRIRTFLKLFKFRNTTL